MDFPGASVPLHAALASEPRARVLDALRSAATPPSAAELGAGLAMPLSNVRFHLRTLIRAGLAAAVVEETGSSSPARRGRPTSRYTAVVGPLPGSGYRLLAEILASATAESSGAASSAARAELAGSRWVARQLPSPRPGLSVGQPELAAAALFTEMGFQPRLDPNPTVDNEGPSASLRLHACPFVEMAREQPDVVCSAHLGVLRGLVENIGPADARAQLVPWHTPTTCLATITYPKEANPCPN